MSLALDHLRRDLAPIVRAIIADVGRRMTPAVVEARAFERLAKIVRGGDELPAERYRRENAGAIAEMEQLGNSRDAAMIVARRRSDNPHTQEMLAQRFRGLRRKKRNESNSFEGSSWRYDQSMATKQTNGPIAHHPTTVAEIRQTRLALYERSRALQDEGAASWKAMQAGAPPSRPLSDHDRRVNAHIQQLMNGSTPSHLLVPAVSRDEQIRAELDAIAYVDRELGRQLEDAQHHETEQWVVDHATEWRALCREIVLAGVRLEALEERARDTLKPIDGRWVKGLAMGSTIGSGLSLLGIGDPLQELRTGALKEGIVTNSELKKAQNVT